MKKKWIALLCACLLLGLLAGCGSKQEIHCALRASGNRTESGIRGL